MTHPPWTISAMLCDFFNKKVPTCQPAQQSSYSRWPPNNGFQKHSLIILKKV
jgi:hypothetical protein